MEKLLLKATEASQMTGYSKNTIYGLIASGQLKSIRLGKAIRIPLKALEEWIEKNQSSDQNEACPQTEPSMPRITPKAGDNFWQVEP